MTPTVEAPLDCLLSMQHECAICHRAFIKHSFRELSVCFKEFARVLGEKERRIEELEPDKQPER